MVCNYVLCICKNLFDFIICWPFIEQETLSAAMGSKKDQKRIFNENLVLNYGFLGKLMLISIK